MPIPCFSKDSFKKPKEKFWNSFISLDHFNLGEKYIEEKISSFTCYFSLPTGVYQQKTMQWQNFSFEVWFYYIASPLHPLTFALITALEYLLVGCLQEM